MTVKIRSEYEITRGSSGAAAFDVRAMDDYVFWPGRLQAVSLGIQSEFPPSLCAVISIERGGLAMKGFEVKAGLVDSDYRGDWKLLLKWNPSFDDRSIFNDPTKLKAHFENHVRILRGDRIGQVLFLNVPEIQIIPCDSFSTTERGEGRFGSTGEK